MYTKKQDLFEDIKRKLNLDNLSFKFLRRQVFSEFYEVSGLDNRYILKISKTGTGIQEEFNTLKKLSSNGINVIQPVCFSKRFNYLITVKEDGLVSLDELIHKGISKDMMRKYLFVFGQELRKINNLTAKDSPFDFDMFISSIKEKLGYTSNFRPEEKDRIVNFLSRKRISINKKNLGVCLTSDFHFCNIMLRNKKDIFLLDFADAALNNEYENLSLIYLCCRYKSKINTEKLFRSFLKGYGLEKIEKEVMDIFIIKHLIDYINHTSDKINKSNLIKRLIYSSDIIKYKLFLNKIISS